MYRAIYILYQFKGVHPFMIHTFNDITSCPPEEFGVHNVNEVIMYSYRLDYSIQMQHYSDYHGQDDDIKYRPPGY